MNDDYEPALEMETTTAGAESEPVVERAPATPDATAKPAAEVQAGPVGEAVEEGGPRAQRVWDPKSRAMFRELAQKVKSQEATLEVDDLVPMEHTPEPAKVAAPALVPAAASPQAQAAAAIAPTPAPVARPVPAPPPGPAPAAPPGLPAQPRAAEPPRNAALEERERALEAREKALAEREKRAPSREKLIEAPLDELAKLLKAEYGLTDDKEVEDAISDLMAEAAERYNKVELPSEVKARLESRGALRRVKAYSAGIAREREELATQKAAQAKAEQEAKEKADIAAYEQRAEDQLTQIIGARTADYPYLAVQDNYAKVVWEVMKEQHNQGQKADWASVAKFANDHFKTQYEQEEAERAKRSARLQSLLAPTAPAAPAAPAASPSAAPGPAAKPQPAPTQQPAVTATPTVDPADDIVGEDRRERRARSLRALVKEHGLGG